METSEPPERPDADAWVPPDTAPSTSTPAPDPDRRPFPLAGTGPAWSRPDGSETAPYGAAPYTPDSTGAEPTGSLPYASSPYGASSGTDPSSANPYATAPYGSAPYGSAPYGPGPDGSTSYGAGEHTAGPYDRFAHTPMPGPYGGGPAYGSAAYGPPVQGPFDHYPGGRPHRPWTMAAPPGTPFHQLARTPLHRWWRPLLGTVVGLLAGLLATLGLYIVGLIIMVVSGGDPLTVTEDGRLFENESLNLGFELLALALFIPAVLLAVFAVQRRPIGTVTSVLGRMRWGWLLVCAGLAAVACALSLGVSLLTGVVAGEGDPWAGMRWSRMFPAVLVIVALVPFQAAAEEYVFRGWLPQAIGSCTLETATGRAGRAASRILRTPWPGIVVGTVAFTAGHAHRGWALLDIAMFGLVAGWLAVRTGGLEAPIALHVLNNLMAFSFATAEGTLANAAQVTDAPWYSLVSSVAQLSVFSALVLWLARRGGIENRRPADAAATGHSVVTEVPSSVPAQPGPSWAGPPTEPRSSHDGAVLPPSGQAVPGPAGPGHPAQGRFQPGHVPPGHVPPGGVDPDRVPSDQGSPDQWPSGPDNPKAV